MREKYEIKIPSKYIWEKTNVIPILPVLWVNHRQPLLHRYKTFVYMNTAEKIINKFAIFI